MLQRGVSKLYELQGDGWKGCVCVWNGMTEARRNGRSCGYLHVAAALIVTFRSHRQSRTWSSPRPLRHAAWCVRVRLACVAGGHNTMRDAWQALLWWKAQRLWPTFWTASNLNLHTSYIPHVVGGCTMRHAITDCSVWRCRTRRRRTGAVHSSGRSQHDDCPPDGRRRE